jgi:hypothetical protein
MPSPRTLVFEAGRRHWAGRHEAHGAIGWNGAAERQCAIGEPDSEMMEAHDRCRGDDRRGVPRPGGAAGGLAR